MPIAKKIVKILSKSACVNHNLPLQNLPASESKSLPTPRRTTAMEFRSYGVASTKQPQAQPSHLPPTVAARRVALSGLLLGQRSSAK